MKNGLGGEKAFETRAVATRNRVLENSFMQVRHGESDEAESSVNAGNVGKNIPPAGRMAL
jgi:hypothetical protein